MTEPRPWEIRIGDDGKQYMWIPDEPRETKKTLSVYRENFEANGDFSMLSFEGRGEIKEIVISANKKFRFFPRVDGVDLLYGKNTFDEIMNFSTYSNTIRANFDDPYYVVSLVSGSNFGIHFSRSADIMARFDSSTIISNFICLYDIMGDA